MGKPILCLDFDGVLHAYTSGWQGVTSIPDGPVPGAAQFIADAQEKFEVHVYSSRSASTEGITAMSAHLLGWLKEGLGGERGYEVWQKVVFPTHKPAAMVGIDDRVITFNGTWPDVNDLRHFKPWDKREESNLVRYAKDEMARIRIEDGERDEIQDAIERDVLDIVQRFADQGHSGSSGAYALGILTKVLDFEPLTPLTGADDEWVLLDYENDMKWQNKRCASVFKRADGTAYHGSAIVHRDPFGACYTGSFSRKEITFPYTPEITYVNVSVDGKPVVDKEAQQRADILLALEAALVLLGRNEPGDSRAVSDQFVAMASAVNGSMNTEGRLILQEILLSGKGLAKVPEQKPYLLFKGTSHYADGGWGDYIDAFADQEGAEARGNSVGSEWGNWWHVVDMRTGKIVAGRKGLYSGQPHNELVADGVKLSVDAK